MKSDEEFVQDVAATLARKVKGNVSYRLTSPSIYPTKDEIFYQVRESRWFRPFGKLHLVLSPIGPSGERCYISRTVEAEAAIREVKLEDYGIKRLVRV